MPENVKKELLAVLAKHGLDSIPAEHLAELSKKPGLPSDIGTKASYIKEIITGKENYDEKILAKVGEALKSFQK